LIREACHAVVFVHELHVPERLGHHVFVAKERESLFRQDVEEGRVVLLKQDRQRGKSQAAGVRRGVVDLQVDADQIGIAALTVDRESYTWVGY